MSEKLILNVKEVAELLGCSVTAVRHRIRRRQLSGWRKVGGSIVFNRQALLNFLNNTSRALTPDGRESSK